MADGPLLVTIAGVDKTSATRYDSITIRDAISQPKTCTFSMDGTAPTNGSSVVISRGTFTLFTGSITSVATATDGDVLTNVRYDVNAIDKTYLLRRRRPFKSYISQPANLIVVDLITAFSSGFTATNVQAPLSSISIRFDGSQDLAACLTTLANLLGAFWYVDDSADVHFFLTETSSAPDAIDNANTSALNDGSLRAVSDIAQSLTRVYVKGSGSQTSAAVANGATSIAVADASQFDPGGGTVKAGVNVVTYTATSGGGSLAGGIATKNGYSTLTAQANVGATTMAVTDSSQFVNANARLADPSGNVINYTGAAANVITGIPASGAGSILTAIPNGSLIKQAYPPPTGSLTVIRLKASVATTAGFSAGGGTAKSGTQVFSYTSASSNVLNGITGMVSLIVAGDPIVPGSGGPGTLTGVPASGAGSVAVALLQGDTVNLWAQRDNTSAQTALAAIEGGDGIHEGLISNPSLISNAECNVAGDAVLGFYASAVVTANYSTRDLKTKSGKTISINRTNPPIVASLTIQDVTVTDCVNVRGPLYKVTASTVRVTLQDVLARILAR